MPDPTGRISHLPDFHRGVSWKQPVRVASTANVTLISALENGDAIDGITLATGDRVLLKNQTTGSENGIWVVAAAGAPTRAFDFDQDLTSSAPAEEALGAVILVLAGTINAATLWRCTNTTSPVIGTTSLTFALAVATPAAGSAGLGFFYADDYGAVGDDSTDDATAIGLAIAAANAIGGGVVLFGPKVYKITTTLTITNAHIHLWGEGNEYGPTVIHMTTANTTAIAFTSSWGDASRTFQGSVRNLMVKGPGGASSGRGIYAKSNIDVEHVGIQGFYDGIYEDDVSFYARIRDCFITGCPDAAIYLNETNNITIDTCRLTGDPLGVSSIDPIGYGVKIVSTSPRGDSLRIVNSSIEYFTLDGIYVDGGGSMSILGNWFETAQSSSGHAYINLGPGSNTVTAVLVEANHFDASTSGFQGIKCDRVTNLTVAENNNTLGGSQLTVLISSTANSSKFTLINNGFGTGTITLPAGSVRIQPGTTITPSAVADAAVVGSGPDVAFGDHVHALGGTAGGDLSGTFPNPSVVDDSHSHTSATLPASSSSGIGDHEHMVDLFAGDNVTTAFELSDEPLDPEAVLAFVAGVETAVTMSGAMNTTATFGAAPGAAARVIIEYPAASA